MEQLAGNVEAPITPGAMASPMDALAHVKKHKKDKKHKKKSKKNKKHHKKAKAAAPVQMQQQPLLGAIPTVRPELLVQQVIPKPVITTTTEILDGGEKKPAAPPANKTKPVPTMKMNSVLTKDFVNGKVSNFTLTVKFSGGKAFNGEPEALEKALHHLVQWENDHKKANKTGPTPVKQLLTSLANEE